MDLHILADNSALIDRYLLAEPGLSMLIEDGEISVLFDTGYSGIFLNNARALGKDLTNLDYLVLSHNHSDHTWGLGTLVRLLTETRLNRLPCSRPALVAHPEIFLSVEDAFVDELGCLLSEDKASRHFPLQLTREPLALSPRLTFLGEIPRRHDFEGQLTFGRKQGAIEGDLVLDDSALVYRAAKGLVIMTGCSHAGICNIVDYAREVCGHEPILDIVGGLHLQSPPQRQMEGTVTYLQGVRPDAVHACHCTDLPSKIALARAVEMHETGVGLSLSYDA